MLPPDGAKTDKKTDDVVVELPGAGGGASSGGGRPPRPPKLGPGGLGKPQPLLPSLSHPHGAGGGGSGHHHGGGAAGSAAGPCGVPLPRTPARRAAAALLLAAFILFGLHRLAGPALTALEPARLRRAFEDAGPLGGPALYALAFTVGELLHVPGVLFVAAGVLVWGCALAPLSHRRNTFLALIHLCVCFS